MRAGTTARILAAGATVLAASLAFAAFLSFRGALTTRLDRAQELESAVIRPAAAARLAAELAAHRLALVSEGESRSVAGAFRGAGADEALEAYRRAGGRASLFEEARRALAAVRGPDAASDVALLRAIRGLRAEAAAGPSPTRPDPPSSAARAGWLLVWATVASGAGALLAYLAGRSRPSPKP
ncbi:MAG: hypothetical protein ABI610_12265 [Acidobacteriota bacterium]